MRLALGLPVLLIVFVAGAIFLPRLWAKPAQYDFVYSKNLSTPDVAYDVSVENGTLVKDMNPGGIDTPDGTPPSVAPQEPKLYVYHVATGESQRISFDDAAALHYQNGPTSRDGYEVRVGSGGGPFSGSGESAIYLRGHGVSTKLTLTGISQNDTYTFQFIGWVEK